MRLTFAQQGAFAAHNAAEKALKEAGFSLGSTQRGEPVGILYGDYCISKWKNMNRREIAALHGKLTGDTRDGPVNVMLYDSAPEVAKVAFGKINVDMPDHQVVQGAQPISSSEHCHVCNKLMDQPDDPSSRNCGGDCRACMAEAGDPDCVD